MIIIVLYRGCASHGSRSIMVYGGCAWLSKIYVSNYVILPRIAKVAEVAEVPWFTGGRGLVIIIVA